MRAIQMVTPRAQASARPDFKSESPQKRPAASWDGASSGFWRAEVKA
jgi:hypothetical protein